MPARRRLQRLVRPLAFACTLVVGIAAGCIWGVVEACEEKIKSTKRPVAEKSHKPS